jgi:subtilisin family serine protease
MLKEYVVCLHDNVDYNLFWNEMETISSIPFIPDRAVEIANEKNGMDRSCHYYLTDEEATILAQESRVYCVEIPVHLRDDVQIGRLLVQTGNFSKTNSSTGNYVNWGLVRVNSPTNLYGTSNTTTINYGYNLDGTGVDVVIQDSGIQADHPEFTNRVQLIDWYSTSGISGTQNANHYRDYDGHGTHVAGIVAGATYGWAKNARIYSLKVNGLEGTGDSGTGISITDCFNVIKNWHLNKPINPKTGFRRPTIVNMSWGYSSGYNSVTSVNYRGTSYSDGSTTGSSSYRWANYGIVPVSGTSTTYAAPVRINSVDVDVQELVKAGVIVCIAAGNSYFKIDNEAGLDYNNYVVTNAATVYYHRGMSPYSNTAIIVGAIDSTSYSSNLDQKADYSNSGPGVDIYSPGSNVLSSTSVTNIYSGTTYYANASYKQVNLSGTSMASPQLAGVGALYLSMNPGVVPSVFKQWIKRSAASNIMYSSGFDADYTNTRSIYSGNNYILFNPFNIPNNGILYATPGSVPTSPIMVTAVAANSFIANVTFTPSLNNGGYPILYYTATSNTGISANSLISPIVVDNLTPGTSYTFVLTATNVVGTSANSTISNSIFTTALSPNSQSFTSAGTYSFIVPRGINSVSVVAVGGGGGGANGDGSGGGGGGLGYKNNITVVPGNSYTVVVGSGGTNSSGGDSYFSSNTIVKGGGGTGGTTFPSISGGTQAGGAGGNYVGDGGGNGGLGGSLDDWTVLQYAGGQGGAGGGAGGYSGNGGRGGNGSSTSTLGTAATAGSGGGGGGGGAGAGIYQTGNGTGAGAGGGGVGIFGQGSNGTAGTNNVGSPIGDGTPGGGGSGGDTGGDNINPFTGGDTGGAGGAYGGGGGGGNGRYNSGSNGGVGGVGGSGAVRIVWPGTTRQFPTTSVGSP